MAKKSFFPVWRGVVFVLVLGFVLATVGIRTATAGEPRPPRPPITNPIDRAIWEALDIWYWIQGLPSGLS